MRLGTRVRGHLDELGILALFAAAELDALLADRSGSTVALLIFPAAWTLPLLFRRRWAAGSAIAILAALALEAQIAYPGTESQIVLVPVILAFFSLGRWEEPARALFAAAIGLLLGGIVVASDSGPVTASGVVFIAIISITPLAAGMIVRARQREADEMALHAYRLEVEQEELAREAVAEERARIARELHDMIGHAISVITVQAGAARLQLDTDPERARDPLLAIEQTGHQALAEMRRLIGMLREMGEPGLAPQPGLEQLDRLLEGVRRSGLPVELRRQGDPIAPVPPLVDLAAYRIVQEALTNALKHGGEGDAMVTVRYSVSSLALEIESQGAAIEGSNGGGHGLVGMRERVDQCRGELQVGETADGGYSVRATLPLGAS